MDKCLRALHARGNELLIVRPRAISDTGFDDSSFGDYAESFVWERPPTTAEVRSVVEGFRPDAILMGNWTRPRSYRAVLRSQPAGVLRVLFLDGQWHGTPRQWLARLTRRLYLAPVFDAAFVAGDRTERWAGLLGFPAEDVIRGAYAADTELFAAGPRDGAELAANGRFLFVGRLVPEKAVDVLAEAYERYRARASEPWDLEVVGIGPLESALSGIPGVTMHGFMQSSELAALMGRCSCLVLPSRFEPWAFVVHEACAAGLPVLVSQAAGAVPGLVEDGASGWIVAPEDPERWAAALERIASAGPERLGEMSRIGQALAGRLSPGHWARNLEEEIARRLPRAGDASAEVAR